MNFLYEYEARRTTFIMNIFIYISFSKNVPKFCGLCSKGIRIKPEVSILRQVSRWNILVQGTLLHIVNVGLMLLIQ